jgi:thiamine-phosphate pyrophosphorylase
MGPKAIIGLSVETWEDVERAESLDCDYLGVSPVFSTPTKTDTKEPWGLEGLSKIRAFSRHPLVGIGGLNAENAGEVVMAGADGVAVVSAICAAPDPFQVSRALTGIIRAALEKRERQGENHRVLSPLFKDGNV